MVENRRPGQCVETGRICIQVAAGGTLSVPASTFPVACGGKLSRELVFGVDKTRFANETDQGVPGEEELTESVCGHTRERRRGALPRTGCRRCGLHGQRCRTQCGTRDPRCHAPRCLQMC